MVVPGGSGEMVLRKWGYNWLGGLVSFRANIHQFFGVFARKNWGIFHGRCVSLPEGNSYTLEIPKTRFTVRSVDVTIDWPDVSQAARQI